MMRMFLLAAAAALTMSAAHAADTKTPVAEIPFANNGGINDWRADSDRVIYVQGQNRQWFKGELLSDCIGLRYAERIAFETEASGAFNKFSSIKVDGKNCPLTSFEKSDPPPKKDKKGEAAKP